MAQNSAQNNLSKDNLKPSFGTSAKGVADVLASGGFISPQQREEVKIAVLETGKTDEEIIREKRLVAEDQLLAAKAEFLSVPYVDLDKVGFSPESHSIVSQNIAEHYNLVAFDVNKTEKTLKVAMANPLDLETIEFLEQKYQHKVFPYLASKEQIEKKIKEGYAQELTDEVTEALIDTGKSSKKTTDPSTEQISKELKEEQPISKVVSSILEFAISSRASDVHIEPTEEDTRLRYRIDGILREELVLPRSIHDAVISRIKILSNLKIDEKRVPQDGRFTFKADGQEVDLRVSTAPTVYGEKVVMRLLKKSQKIPDLQELGLRGRALHNLQEAVSRPHGIVIVCGPTGSGKTTTLYSALSKLNTVKVNMMTIEDPVEYKIAGVNQVQVNPQAGLTFSSALRSFLRQDPDIIMVGEIRDKETAELAVQAALTGHLVFSTLHTNDASGAAPRMIDMGTEPFLLVSSLSCIVGQRVLRKICPSCREEYAPPPQVTEDIKSALGSLLDKEKAEKLTLFKGKGCPECNNTGYLGRVGIFEVLTISDKVTKLILEKQSSGQIQKIAVEEGMITMMQDGYQKAVEGITTIEEVLRVAKY
jgi:type IV pilus assembly protein PilB